MRSARIKGTSPQFLRGFTPRVAFGQFIPYDFQRFLRGVWVWLAEILPESLEFNQDHRVWPMFCEPLVALSDLGGRLQVPFRDVRKSLFQGKMGTRKQDRYPGLVRDIGFGTFKVRPRPRCLSTVKQFAGFFEFAAVESKFGPDAERVRAPQRRVRPQRRFWHPSLCKQLCEAFRTFEVGPGLREISRAPQPATFVPQ